MCHVGAGTISDLGRITNQMEATDLFGDTFARRLEMLGHIEIERNLKTLAGVSWQVNDPTIIGLPSGELAVTGFRSERTMVAMKMQSMLPETSRYAKRKSLDRRWFSFVGCRPMMSSKSLTQSQLLRTTSATCPRSGR